MGRLLSPRHAAEKLGISIDSLRRWEQQGILPSERTPGNQRRFHEEDILAVLNNRPLHRSPPQSRLPRQQSEDEEGEEDVATGERESPTLSTELLTVWNEARRYILVNTTRPVPWPRNDPVYLMLLRNGDPIPNYFDWSAESSDTCSRLCEKRVRARLHPGVTFDLLVPVIWQTILEYATYEQDRQIRGQLAAEGMLVD